MVVLMRAISGKKSAGDIDFSAAIVAGKTVVEKHSVFYQPITSGITLSQQNDFGTACRKFVGESQSTRHSEKNGITCQRAQTAMHYSVNSGCNRVFFVHISINGEALPNRAKPPNPISRPFIT
jgi:hypothetical protein